MLPQCSSGKLFNGCVSVYINCSLVGNFSDDDDLGTPVIDTILDPGDLLYFPRGFIHQVRSMNLTPYVVQ